MKKLFEKKNFYILVGFISAFSLISAFYIEHILNIAPCKLCLYQRIPYFAILFLCFIGFLNIKNSLWIYLLSFSFLISSFLAGYHFGIENNIFPEFSGCKTNNLNIIDKDELLNLLLENLPNCKNVNYRLFGFSLATLNLFISSVLFTISLLIIKNEKNR